MATLTRWEQWEALKVQHNGRVPIIEWRRAVRPWDERLPEVRDFMSRIKGR